MGLAPQFTTFIDSNDDVGSISLSGELDMASVSVLEASLAFFEGDGVDSIRLDLRDLTFIDSSGIHALLQARDRATERGQRLACVGASSRTRRVFDLVGTELILDPQEIAGPRN